MCVDVVSERRTGRRRAVDVRVTLSKEAKDASEVGAEMESGALEAKDEQEYSGVVSVVLREKKYGFLQRADGSEKVLSAVRCISSDVLLTAQLGRANTQCSSILPRSQTLSEAQLRRATP